MVPDLQSADVLSELQSRIQDELSAFVATSHPDIDEVPRVVRCKELDKGDFMMLWAPLCAKKKLNPAQFTTELATALQARLDQPAAGADARLVRRVIGIGPYLNIFVHKATVYRLVMRAVAARGVKFGHTQSKAGQRVVIEHTSSNPNAPLHIGNLRNVMIGAHLARLMEAVGYDVQQLFYVNDLGAQIGLTALAYSRVYKILKPDMKIDQWIGAMYAIMNTFSELQKVGVDIVALGEALTAKGLDAMNALAASFADKAADEEAKKNVKEYADIFQDLYYRYKDMFAACLQVTHDIPNIKDAAGELNLAYERQQPEAIKVFRKMVADCLGGVQQTLDIYGVRHTRWDYESELGWEGSNTKVMDIMKRSPYFVPPTQSNAEGKPQGGYLDMSKFIADQKLAVGKKGYMKDYPPLYVLRPDFSTLYTFRDVVYSFKKAANADRVLNIICSEQNLAQEKVALAMYMMNPDMVDRQYHVSYELVKLTTGKMSGRRGRYLLADDLYDELKEVITDKMRAKYEEKGEALDPALFNKITHEVSTAAMKYALLAVSLRSVINFNIAKVTDFEDASAPFILYNSTRLTSLMNKFDAKVAAGELQPLPRLDECDLNTLDDTVGARGGLLVVISTPVASRAVS
eukprot:jgi/Mesvir1/25743/Mv01924-RA.2